MAVPQKFTLSLPRELLRRVERLAVERRTSVPVLILEALTHLSDKDRRRYAAAQRRALAAMRNARSLGTGGRRAWTRDDLHAR